MGNRNLCCNSRYEDITLQPRKSRIPDTADLIEKLRKSHKQEQKQSLTFGDHLINEIRELTDLIVNPVDEQWQVLFEGQNLKIFAFEWKMNEKSMQWISTEFELNMEINAYINQNEEQMKVHNQRIDGFQIIDENAQFEESRRYISYKNLMMISGRDFVYYRKVKQFNDECFEVVQSITDEQWPPRKGKIRGQINICGQHITKIKQGIRVRQYIDVDFRMNVGLKTLEKTIVKEMKQYIDSYQ